MAKHKLEDAVTLNMVEYEVLKLIAEKASDQGLTARELAQGTELPVHKVLNAATLLCRIEAALLLPGGRYKANDWTRDLASRQIRG